MDTLSFNEKTIAAYDHNIQAYINSTPVSLAKFSPKMREWIDKSLECISKRSGILEIGTGIPRDARYIRDRGYTITCSDAALGFVENLRKQGENAAHINVLEDDLGGKYGMVFANAVIQHFTVHDFDLALKKIHDALTPNGIFAFSTKQGEGNQWINEKFHEKRYVHYWQQQKLESFLAHRGYKIIFTSQNKGVLPNHYWLNVIAQKVA